MKLSAAELRKRIEQGEDLDAISLSLMSAAERGLLKCCAVVRTFDEKLVDSYFRPQVPGAEKASLPFSTLTGHDFVQRVPRTDNVYFLLPASRKQYYDSWWESSDGNVTVSRSEVPEALRKLSLSLTQHYAALGEAAELDLLAQQVFVDKQKACEAFEELYKEADAAFNLARCRDIINVIKGFENVLGPELAKALNDTDRYLQSRSLWATEYYQTVSYYDRKELNTQLESFLNDNAEPAPDKKWILHLHAPGGMGKTMFVRWLISRRCVPEPHTIPCGRIDFDFVDRITASQHRWKLFLDIARELEVQIPGNYFHSLIKRFTDYELILNRQQTQQSTSTSLPPREKLEGEMLYLFGNALRDANLKKPIILIFDTLEEVILYHPEDLLEIVRQVNQLRPANDQDKTAPNVLVVLSGRYDLTETGPQSATRLPQFNAEFGAVTQSMRVEPFDKEEALGFLQMRGLTKDRPLDIVVERSDGNPFKLALFADILLDDPQITADDIRGYPRTDLQYLIERVLARIPNDTLHWLLRYGVVPRKLTLSFVKDVIRPHLERAISGDRSHDDPSRYAFLTSKAQATVQQKKIFVQNTDAPVRKLQDDQLDQLWAELQNYASKYAWVTMEASDPYTAVFHGDVVNPMRRWLEENPVYKLLHQDAIAYYEDKAKNDPEDWAKWMRNAIYHRFQLQGAQAAEYWRDLIEHEDDPSRRWDLANEIIGSEYVDENFKPRLLLEKQEIITRAILAEAYFELARAGVEIARAQNAPANDQLWSDASNDLDKCEQLQRESAQKILLPAYVTSVRAAILTNQGLGDKAISIIEDALNRHPDNRELVRLEAELGNAFAARKDHQKASFYWESALNRAESSGVDSRFIVETRRRLARLYRDEMDLEGSAFHLQTALELVRPDDEKRSELLNELADLYFDMGLFSRARKTFELRRSLDDQLSPATSLRYQNQSNRFYQCVDDPLEALRTQDAIERAFAVAKSNQLLEDLNVLIIEGEELRGMLHSMLFEVESARQAFESARSRWRLLGDSKAAKRCMLKKVEVYLKQGGEVNQARSILEEATRLTIDYDPQQWLEETLLRLEILHLSQEIDDWQSGVQQLEKRAADERWKPLLRAKMSLALGVWRLVPNDKPAATQFFSGLTPILRQIEPPAARLLLLEPLSRYPSYKDMDYEVTEDLISLFPLRKGDEDFNVHGPRLAELLRVVGRTDHAVSLLKELVRTTPKENSFALRRVLLTFARTSPRTGKLSDLKRFIRRLTRDFANYPVLCGATLVEFAELSFTTRSTAARLELLDEAEKLLTDTGEESHWMARLFALRGRLNMKDRPSEALEQLGRAIHVNWGLGNYLAATNLEPFIASLNKSLSVGAGDVYGKGKPSLPSYESEITKPADELVQPATTIHIEGSWAENVTIHTTFPNNEVMTRNLPIEPGSLLDQVLAFDTYENYSFSFLREMDEDWVGVCKGLGKILVGDREVRRLQTFVEENSRLTALSLVIDALQLSSAPWEMMVLPSQPDSPASVSPFVRFFYRSLAQDNLRSIADITWLQMALSQLGVQRLWVDGVYGKSTDDAVRGFQRSWALPDHGRFDGATRRAIKNKLHKEAGRHRPRVLLLQPSIARQRATSRGQQVYGFSVEDAYKREGFREVVVVEDPHVALLEETLIDFTPDVVHICPTMEESTSVGIYLDFGSGGTGVMPRRKGSMHRTEAAESGGEVQFLTLSALADLMRRKQKREHARPLLILDVLEPAGQTELFTELFLRNAFAAQLYQLGAFESIIATGLTPPEIQEPMSRTLISRIGVFDSVGETVNEMRRIVDVGSYTHLPPVGQNLGPLRDPSDRRYLSSVAATAGIALFTQDPEM